MSQNIGINISDNNTTAADVGDDKQQQNIRRV